MSDDASCCFDFAFSAAEIRVLLRRQKTGRGKTILAAMRIPAAILPSSAWLAAWGYLEPALVSLVLFAIACLLIGGMLWRSGEEITATAVEPRRVILGPRGVKLLRQDSCTLLHWRLLSEVVRESGMLLFTDDDGRAWAAVPERILRDESTEGLQARLAAWRAAAPAPSDWPDDASHQATSPESAMPELERCTESVEFTPTVEDELDALGLIYSPRRPVNFSHRALESMWLMGLALLLAHLFDSQWDWAQQVPWKYLGGAPLMLVALLLPQAFLKATEFLDRRHHRDLLSNGARLNRAPVRYAVCREGLLTETADVITLEPWTALTGLQSRERMVVLTSKSGAVFFVPWSAFATASQREEFQRRAEKCLAAQDEPTQRDLTSAERELIGPRRPESGNPFEPPRAS